jgi:hypothetical protein
MFSHGEGVGAVATQGKLLSPEIILVALGQGFHWPKRAEKEGTQSKPK